MACVMQGKEDADAHRSKKRGGMKQRRISDGGLWSLIDAQTAYMSYRSSLSVRRSRQSMRDSQTLARQRDCLT